MAMAIAAEWELEIWWDLEESLAPMALKALPKAWPTVTDRLTRSCHEVEVMVVVRSSTCW